MGEITSLFVWKVIRAVDPTVDQDELLRSIGIDPGEPVDPSRMVLDTDYYALLERAARLDPLGHTLPLRVGASMRCDEYRAFGLAWKSAPNLRGSYERAERYARMLTNVASYKREISPEGVWFQLHRDGERRLGLRISNEATIASVFAISQQVSTRPLQPLAVHFQHPAPANEDRHARHFGCPVYFNSDQDALLISHAASEVPNQQGDAGLTLFFEQHLDAELSKFKDDASLPTRVKHEVSQALSGGIPLVSEIARLLGMSGRTLQRQLSELGYSYQALVDESRRELSERLLAQTNYSMLDIAFMTGFSEQSAFTRAFKRWAGQTPRSFRLSPPTS